MSRRLVTIATFDLQPQARMAQNALEAAGIRAAVADETLVAMDWLLATAVGGIKVQIWEEDAERAVAVLEEAFGEQGEGLGAAASDGQPAADAPPAEAFRDDPTEPAPAAVRGPDEPTLEPSERDRYARRTVFSVWLAVLFPPFAFYSLYLFLNAAFGEGELSGQGRYHLVVGGLMLAVLLAICFVVFPYLIFPLAL